MAFASARASREYDSIQNCMESIPLILAGSLLLLGTAIHGIAGEALVVRALSPAMLPSTRLGGPRMTEAMIRASWHLTTVAFLSVGLGLLLAGSVLDGDTARGVGLLAAAAATGFAAVTVALAGRSFFRHPAPALLTAAAALAWWGLL